jgi:hypothetical protein
MNASAPETPKEASPMINTTISSALAGQKAVAFGQFGSRLLDVALPGTSGVRPIASVVRERICARPVQAPVMAVARADAYALTAEGAGSQIFGQQKTQLHTMWALRGLNPWSDPA